MPSAIEDRLKRRQDAGAQRSTAAGRPTLSRAVGRVLQRVILSHQRARGFTALPHRCALAAPRLAACGAKMAGIHAAQISRPPRAHSPEDSMRSLSVPRLRKGGIHDTVVQGHKQRRNKKMHAVFVKSLTHESRRAHLHTWADMDTNCFTVSTLGPFNCASHKARPTW